MASLGDHVARTSVHEGEECGPQRRDREAALGAPWSTLDMSRGRERLRGGAECASVGDRRTWMYVRAWNRDADRAESAGLPHIPPSL